MITYTPAFTREPWIDTTAQIAALVEQYPQFDWAASNARLEQSAANTTALIEQMRADHASDAEFQKRWNAMSYREAVEFQRARTQETSPC